MNRILRHIVRSIMALLIMSLPAACSTENDSLPESPAGDGTVMLVVNTAVIGSSRAGDGQTYPDNEKMKTLRIVILHADGTVEYNRFIDFGTVAQTEYYYHLIKVRQNEKKAVFLIANEESVNNALKAELDAFTEGQAGLKDKLNGIVFKLDGTKPLPMSAEYELDVKEKNQECQFYLVRAATKFTYRFRNYRNEAVTVNSITVNDIAEDMYLMAHKQNPMTMMNFEETDGTQIPLYWIDWLKRVSDESQEHPEDKTLADRRGWIKDYDIPQTTSRPATVTPSSNFTIPARTINGGILSPGVNNLPDFYLPESKHLAYAGGVSADVYGEQSYTMTFKLSDGKEEKTFDYPFDNLKALFRNTNVVVNVDIYQKEIRVDVVPYSEVILNPIFGLSRGLNFVPVYGEDDEIWYYYDPKTGTYYGSDGTTPIQNPYAGTIKHDGIELVIIYNLRDEIIGYYDPKEAQYYDPEFNKVKHIDEDASTGWKILYDAEDVLIGFYDPDNKKLYDVNKSAVDKLHDPENPTWEVQFNDKWEVSGYYDTKNKKHYDANRNLIK